MLAALEQAWLGRGTCAPNPSVGAVAAHNGEIVARAWHHGPGSAHAEQLVLESLPKDLKNVTLYVTLEPCNHWGRTPPCVSAIIHHKVSHVVYGFTDPNPLVATNNTPQLLQAAGIDVSFFPMPEIEHFYQSYAYWTLTKKPWVTAKIAQSLDSKIAGVNGARCQLSNAACAEFTHQKRLHSDVILTTAKTIHQDNPLLNARLKEQAHSKVVAILDRQLTLTQNAKVFANAKHCHIYHQENCPVMEPIPNCSYHAVPVKNESLDLETVISSLGALGYHDVWVEAGGKLFSALHQNNLVQRTYVYLTPEILGDNATPTFHGDVNFSKKKNISWQIKEDNIIACFDWQEERCLQD